MLRRGGAVEEHRDALAQQTGLRVAHLERDDVDHLVTERAPGTLVHGAAETESGGLAPGALDAVATLEPQGPALEWLDDAARWAGEPLVAASGERFLLAWNDERDGSPDVYRRLVRAGSVEGADERWNTDGPSANQGSARDQSSEASAAIRPAPRW